MISRYYVDDSHYCRHETQRYGNVAVAADAAAIIFAAAVLIFTRVTMLMLRCRHAYFIAESA